MRRRIPVLPMSSMNRPVEGRVGVATGAPLRLRNAGGTRKDLAVVPQGQFPAVQWAILATGNGEQIVKWSDMAQEIGHLRLRSRKEGMTAVTLPPEALRLSRDLMDKQIVDTHGAK